MESLRKSFKSHGSHKHTRKISAGGGGEEQKHEELPILLEYDDGVKKSLDSGDTREFSGNNNGNMSQNTGGGSRDVELVLQPDGTKMWRESSYDFWKEDGPVAGDGGNASQSSGAKDGYYFLQRPQGLEDPPSNLIGQFLNKQRAAGEILLDMDLEMDELRHDRSLLPSITESPTTRQVSEREPKVSFQEHPSSNRVEIESVRQWYNESLDEDHPHHQHSRSSANLSGGGGGGVLRCSSNALFRRTSGLLRIRTKSRLMDPPPEEQDRRSGRVMKSGQLKSGMLGKAEDDEDDPLEEDLPNEFKKANFSTLTVLQWISLILIVAAFVCTISIPVFRSRILWHLHLWKWEVLILVLICGRLVSGWGIRIVVFFIERNFVLRKRVLYFVYGVRKAVQNCLWLGLVLIAWLFMFDKKVEEHTKSGTLVYVTKILVCLLVGTLIWLVKTLLVKVLASSFHVSTFFDRIQESLFNQYVIETLSGPPLIEIQNTQEEEDRVMTEVHRLQNAGATMPADLRATAFPMSKSGTVIGSGGLQRSSLIGKSFKFSGPVSKKQDNGITIEDLHKLNQKNISAWNMKRLMNIVRHGFLSTLDEQILDSTHGDDSAMQIRSEIEAKTAARKIFNNVAKLGSNRYIYPEDLMRFVREDEALKTMSLFEGAIESKRISKSALKKWVVNAFRERKALSLTLNDTKTAVNKLHHIVNIIVGGIIVVIWLLILGIATTQFLVVMSSQLLLVAFVFGNTCKTTFEAIIFLFVMHPYDVGDRCEVDGVQMIVEEMNILTTVFLRYDSQKIIYPNSVLSTMPISNYYRSPDMGDAIEFCIHISTPVEKIACMRERIVRYIENKKDHWHPAPTVILKDVEDMNRLKMAVWLTHRMNHQDMGTRWARRALLVEEMLKIFRELNIEYRMLPLDINVQKMPTIASTRLPSNWAACIN